MAGTMRDGVAAAQRGERVTIGALAPLVAGAYTSMVISGAVEGADEAGARLVAIQTLDLSQGSLNTPVPRFTLRAGWDLVDGFIVVVNAVDRDYLLALQTAGKPVVTIASDLEGVRCPVVKADNRGGVHQAVSHLVEHGHRRIGFAGCLLQTDIQERYAAYREALAAHGIVPEDTLLFEASDNLESGGEVAARQMLDAGMPSTAIIAGTDWNALGVMRMLTQTGLALPHDQAIVGFDDVEMSSSVRPTISSVHQSFAETGRRAAGLVVEMVRGRRVAAQSHLVPTSFVPRESCGCTTRSALRVLGEASPDLFAPPRDRLRTRLGRLLTAGEAPTAGQSAALDRAVELILPTSAEASGRHTDNVREAARKLLSVAPRWASITAAVDCLREYGEEARRDPQLAASAPPDRVITDLAVELSRALAERESSANSDLHFAAARWFQLSMSLLSGTSGDPRSLGWVASTGARAGCLGMWSEAPGGGPERRLRVAGSFQRDAAGPVSLPETLRPEEFPPAGFLRDLDWGRRELAVVLPLRTPEMDLGLIAMVLPVVTNQATGRDVLYETGALLSVSIESQVMMEWLRAQTEDLARAVKRERDLREEIRRSEERYALAARATNDGLWDWDLGASTIFYSNRWKGLLGYQGSDLAGAPEDWFDRVHPDDLPRLREALDACIAGATEVMECEHRLRARGDSYRWMLCQALAVRDATDGRATRLVGSLTDVTAQRELEEQLRYGAHHDSLTSLPNRTLFLERLTQALARAERNPAARVGLLFLDLDGFKQVNDRYGHTVGDQLLVQVAERISQRLRRSDTAARLGGDEFAVLLEDVSDPASVRTIAGDLSGRLSAPYDIDGNRLEVTASIGTAVSGTGHEHPDDLLRDADTAMYSIKLGRRPPEVDPPSPA
ncbi:MAG TPA: diguanylate cyclase [Candidatus Binatia bacterium]|nr:diguanylate cyclase [Candidatus Binatia bacterium]